MNPFVAFDRWVGKTFFVPLIVRVCQKFGFTQFFVHNYLYLIGSYMMLAAAIEKGDASGISLAFVLALVFTVLVGKNPGYEGAPSPYLRGWWLFENIIHTAAHVSGQSLLFAGPNWDLSCPVALMWLAAEYARTIKTIPPLEAEEREPSGKLAHQEGN